MKTHNYLFALITFLLFWGNISLPLFSHEQCEKEFRQMLEPFVQKAQIEKKPIILVLVGNGGWCKWSEQLDKDLLQDSEHYKEFQNFAIPVVIKYPRTDDVLTPQQCNICKYIVQQHHVTAFPYFILLDSTGRAFSQWGFARKGYKQTLIELQQLIQYEKQIQKELAQIDFKDKQKYAYSLHTIYQNLPKTSRCYYQNLVKEILTNLNQDSEMINIYAWEGIILPFFKKKMFMAEENRDKILCKVHEILKESQSNPEILQDKEKMAFLKSQTIKAEITYKNNLKMIAIDLEGMSKKYQLDNEQNQMLYFLIARLYASIEDPKKAIDILNLSLKTAPKNALRISMEQFCISLNKSLEKTIQQKENAETLKNIPKQYKEREKNEVF